MTTFGERLKKLKEMDGHTWRGLAGKVGVSVGTLFAWINGTHDPRLSYLIWLADYFEASLDYLVGRESP